jgi:uncharacterized CHY-type Zn-finger protein
VSKGEAIKRDLNRMASAIFGRTREEALHDNVCVKCGETAFTFRDALSMREYRITAFCQSCQDKFYEQGVDPTQDPE